MTNSDKRKEFKEIKTKLLESDNYKKCVNCGSNLEIQLHHIIPLSLGGTNNISNIVALCGKCHGKIHGMNYNMHSELTKRGIREARKNGKQIGGVKGKKMTTKKSIKTKEQIKKYSKDFEGTLTDPEVIKICQVNRNSYYKYKRELKEELGKDK